ncbi:MAG: tail fiber protein [Bryobacteraceae bacterium]|jgi:microcystin-dependent protein
MTPFLGQLMLASWNYTTQGWAMCNGQLLPINQNAALFSLLGTTYGGDGISTFALPNLQGRTPAGFGNGIQLGQVGGEEFHTLLSAEVPAHSHPLQAASGANLTKPGGALVAGGGASLYTGASNLAAMNAGTIGNSGGGLPHENRQPYLVMNWCIALTGIFPSQN